MCKKIITLYDDMYRVEIKEEPIHYVLQKKTEYLNKDTKEKEIRYQPVGYYPDLGILVNVLTKRVAIDKIESEHINEEECNLSIKQYLRLLNDTEKEIKELLKGF